MRFLCAVSLAIGVAVATAAGAAGPAGGDPVAGVRQFAVPSAARGADLDVTVWYPASGGGTEERIGESVFFEGVPALRDATIADGRFPLVLLSHGAGLGGRAEAASWIAAPLAERGFVVAAPTHPGNTGPARSAAETMKLWLRPADVSATMDALVADPVLGARLSPAPAGLLGLSLGGHTALALAGARIDPAGLAAACDGEGAGSSLCAWVTESGVDLRAMDMNGAGDGTTDPRIGFVIAIDPALTGVFVAESLAEIAIPVTILNLGQDGGAVAALDASAVAAAIPDGTHAVIADASHFSLFGPCRPGAAEIALEEGIEEPICTDGGVRPRGEIHAEIVETVAAAFRDALAVQN